MATKYESTLKRWPGHILLGDYMPFPDLLKWEKALEQAKALDSTSSVNEFYNRLLPVACGMVHEWHIQGLPEKVSLENFPASAKLVAFVVESITDLYTKTNEPLDPKPEGQSSTT